MVHIYPIAFEFLNPAKSAVGRLQILGETITGLKRIIAGKIL